MPNLEMSHSEIIKFLQSVSKSQTIDNMATGKVSGYNEQGRVYTIELTNGERVLATTDPTEDVYLVGTFVSVARLAKIKTVVKIMGYATAPTDFTNEKLYIV